MAIFLSRFALKNQYSSKSRGFSSTNQDGDNIPKVFSLAAKPFFLEIFQIFAQNITRISSNIFFFFKSSIIEGVYLGLSCEPPSFQPYRTKRNFSWLENYLFVLPMDEGLDKFMKAIYIIKREVPI